MADLRQATAPEPGPVPRSVPPGEPDGTEQPAPAEPGIIDTAKRLLDEASAAAQSTRDTLQAIRTLAMAEFALATSAISRAAVMAVAAAIAALVGVFYVFATLSALMVEFGGLSWSAALAISTLLLLVTAGTLLWRALALTRLARFDGTRRQLARFREGAP